MNKKINQIKLVILLILSYLIPFRKSRVKFRNHLFKSKIKNTKTQTIYKKHRALYNIGEYSYAAFDVEISNKNTKIGKFTSIGYGVFIGTSQHPTNFLSTHPMQYTKSAPHLYGDLTVESKYLKDISDINKPCEVGNDVWIGQRAMIMDGLKIGDGAIVGAGAVVTKDVPPYAIVAGVPARIIRYRFNEQIINELLELKWWDFPKEIITTLPFDNVEKCIETLKESKSINEKTHQ